MVQRQEKKRTLTVDIEVGRLTFLVAAGLNPWARDTDSLRKEIGAFDVDAEGAESQFLSLPLN